jgi:hypothetical protein
MATYYVSQRGNSALQAECWRLSTDEAHRWLQAYDTGNGSNAQWLRKAYRRARRAHAAVCTLTTGGCATGEFANQLRALDIAVTERETYR